MCETELEKRSNCCGVRCLGGWCQSKSHVTCLLYELLRSEGLEVRGCSLGLPLKA